MTIKENVEQFRDALTSFNVSNIDDLCCDLENMLSNNLSPDNYWELLAYGSFKECYDIKSNNCIVKFASTENETEKEKIVLSQAYDDDLGYVFLRTIFIPLAENLPATHVDYDCTDRYRYNTYKHIYEDTVFLDCIIVQARMEVTSWRSVGDKDVESEESLYKLNPIIINGSEIMPFDEARGMPFDSITWMQTFIDKYGYDEFKRLKYFIDHNNISDLHDNNIGYMSDGSPVIVDYWS